MKKYILIFVITAMTVMAAESIADSPVPKPPPDHFLVGIKKIVVWSYSTMADDDQVGLFYRPQNKIHDIDYDKLSQNIADNLSALLPPDMTNKIVIQSVSSAKIDPFRVTDENILLIGFNFGFQLSKVDNKEVILGAVHPTMRRLPPQEMQGDRTSGFHRQFSILTPMHSFVLRGDQIVTINLMQIESQSSVEAVVRWLNKLLPITESPKKLKNKQPDDLGE